ncbi:hypothetical protein ACFL1H_04930 [Nanoarchaeota archaeon]
MVGGLVKKLVLGVGLVSTASLLGGCSLYQGGSLSRLGMGDPELQLPSECVDVNYAGKYPSGEETTTKFVDCITSRGTHILKEYKDWAIFEAQYEFVPEGVAKDPTYQGGWGSRLDGDKKKLIIPKDCNKILNIGKAGTRKYIACEMQEGTYLLREFSDWKVFQASYIFSKDAKTGLKYQGGWNSRLGGKAQVLPMPQGCEIIKHIGRTGNKKYVDCTTKEGLRMLKEFKDWGVLEASYIFTDDAKDGFRYQGGLVSRFGGEPQKLKLPDDCLKIKNVGRSASTKYVVCENSSGEDFLKEYSDLGVFEATYRFVTEK